MKARGHGAIVNISSCSARTGRPDHTQYVVAKHELMSLTANVAREGGPHGVRYNSILSACFDTSVVRLIALAAEKSRQMVAEARAEYLRYVSMRTMIDPDDVADAVVFLASDAAHFVTGKYLGVCGNGE